MWLHDNFWSQKGRSKNTQPQEKKTNLVSKKQTKQEHDIQNNLEKKYVDTKTNQPKNKKNVTFTPTIAMLIRNRQIP